MLLLSNMGCKIYVSVIILTAVIAVSSSAEVCPVEEHWINCKLAFSGPQTCKDLGWPRAEVLVNGPCLGGCICDEGYLRNSDNVCIHVGECPSCGGDMNATTGNGVHCGNLCSNYRDSYALCTDNPGSNLLCSCKKGYVFNDIIGKCVHPGDCPKPCEGDFYAIEKSCSSKSRPTCAEPKQKRIKSCESCECVDNYILDKPGGKCIKFKDCPAGCQGDANATATSCDCGQANCISRYAQCVNGCGDGFSLGCKCHPGYIRRDSDGPCILEEDCHWFYS